MGNDTQVHVVDALQDAHLALAELSQRLPEDMEDDLNARGAWERAVGAVETALALLGEDFGESLLAPDEEEEK